MLAALLWLLGFREELPFDWRPRSSERHYYNEISRAVELDVRNERNLRRYYLKAGTDGVIRAFNACSCFRIAALAALWNPPDGGDPGDAHPA